MSMDKPGTQTAATCKLVTTFVQTDTNTFREVVQRLTGPSDNIASPEVTAAKPVPPKRPTSKLHERRQCMRPKLEIVKPTLSFKTGGVSSKSGNASLLTSPMGTPSTIFSKLSIFEEEITEAGIYEPNTQEEYKAIREGRFYLHPSPDSRAAYSEPELLTLFPLTSPRSSDKP